MKRILIIAAVVLIAASASLVDAGPCDFFYDCFTKQNGWGVYYGKWSSSGGWANYVSNNMAYMEPGDGSWWAAHFRPNNAAQSDAVFDAENGITIEIDLGPWTNTSASTGKIQMKLSVLNMVVSDDPYSLAATGVVLYAELQENQADIAFKFSRKMGVTNSNGTWFGGASNATWVSGATLSYKFNATTVTVNYNGSFVSAAEHEVTVSNWNNWYVGFMVQNENGRGKFWNDNVKITGPGAAWDNTFFDVFSGTNGDNVTNSKWYIEKGSATITNNQCKMVPQDWGWGMVAIIAKENYENAIRMRSDMAVVVFTSVIANIEVTTAATDDDLLYKMEWWPELNYNDSWGYNSTSLSVEIKFDTDGGQTSVWCELYRYWKAEANRTSLISSSETNFVPGRPFVFKISDTDFYAYYGDWLMGSSALGFDFSDYYSEGAFFQCIGQNFDTGRGVIYVDEVRANAVPEPTLLFALAAAMLLARGKR